jgi:transcriptional regulator with XRE-family HTH domain
MIDGKKIKKMREKRGLSLRESAAYILGRTGVEINSVTIGLLERGTQPDIKTEAAAAIATAYGVGITDIMTPERVVA